MLPYQIDWSEKDTERYNYNDITLYKRVTGGSYLNLTDFELEGNNQQIDIPDEDSEYIIVYNNYKSTNISEVLYSRATIEIMQSIAGGNIQNKKTQNSKAFEIFKNISGVTKFMDLICAEIIVDAGNSKRIFISNNIADFQYRKYRQNSEKKLISEWVSSIELDVIHGSKIEKG